MGGFCPVLPYCEYIKFSYPLCSTFLNKNFFSLSQISFNNLIKISDINYSTFSDKLKPDEELSPKYALL